LSAIGETPSDWSSLSLFSKPKLRRDFPAECVMSSQRFARLEDGVTPVGDLASVVHFPEALGLPLFKLANNLEILA